MTRRLLAPLALVSLAIALGALGELRAERAKSKAPSDGGVVTLRAPIEGRVVIPAGAFTMGADLDEILFATQQCRAEPAGEVCREEIFLNEAAAHTVTLSKYAIDRLEVAMGDYQRCVEAGPCGPLPIAAGGARINQPTLPASMVTHSDATTYCKYRGGRLPTEAEWERAARGLKGRRYPWGNVFDPYLANGGRLAIDPYEDKDGFLEAAPVGSFPDGRTPDGIYDLAGNVEEWVADWYEPQYSDEAQTNPKGPNQGDERVVRGGSFIHGRAWLRTTARGKDLPGVRRPHRGFRCAYDP
ncbi:MAG: SUMF1/EgtB/PvdO family nonheme iron enzyme [Polyangiaceae bacterium]